MPEAAPTPSHGDAVTQIARRVASPPPVRAPWIPPALPPLIDRIERALRERRGG